MKNRNLIIGLVVGFIAVAGIGFAIAASNNNDSNSGDHMTKDQSNTQASDTQAPAAKADVANSITIQDYKFSPASMTVKVGTKVTWTNQDSVKHSVTADSGDGPKSELFGKGETYSYTFTKAGTFNYHCIPHPYMKASITVTE